MRLRHTPNMNALRRALLISTLTGVSILALAPAARAIAPISDDSEVFVTGVATVSENDNLFLNHSNPTRTSVTDLVPGFSYEFGKGASLVTGQFAYSEDFQFFGKAGSQLDYQLANIIFWLKYNDAANAFNVDASFHQADQPEVGIQNVDFLVNRDLYHADGTDEMSLTEKTSFSLGGAIDDTHYRQPGYADYLYTEVPINVYFKAEPKLDLSAGFRYRNNSIGLGGIDSDDYFYNVGARGEFTPNLTGEFNVGYQVSQLVNGPEYNGLGLDSKFTYAVDPKTSINLTATDDFSYSATSDAIRTIGTTLGFTSSLSEQWAVSAQLGYNDYSYLTTPRKDNYYSAQASLSYIVNQHVSFSLSYTFGKDDSNVLADSFIDNIFGISGALRF